ncbi:MAG: sulfotransferase [Phycisphaerales bacterium]|nr:sulfotransferase [Phycisphaerales bacterium]
MLELLKPYARTAKLRLLKRRAERLARTPVAAERGEDPALPPPVFIFACGRSGTTILGKLFGCHPEVVYLREPYHLWATIEPALDVTNLHVRTPPRLWWDASDATDHIRARFARLVLGERERSGRRVLMEKTPHNAYRIGLLEALTGGRARFVHIVRDGVDVARSIDRLATNQPYRMAGRPDYNQWWGSNELKWKRLQAEGPGRGHFSNDEVARLTGQAQRGAYEWLTSLGEADRWRPVLGERLLEITYPTLTGDTGATLRRLAEHVGASVPEAWLAEAGAMVSDERKNKGKELALPARMAAQFNHYQERHGFGNRAVELGGS